MERESFVFYRSFYEGIKELPRDIQGEVLTAIMEYGLNGVTTENQKPITKAMFALIKPQLDANNQRFENGKLGAEHGKKGGRPRKEKPQENPTLTPKKPQENPNLTPNVNDNVNVNDNISFLEKKKQKSASVDFSEEEKNNQPLSDQKETSPRVAAAPPPFNFRQAMLSAGFAADLTEDWLRIRKAKKAVNSERAFKLFIEQVQRTGQDKNTILTLVVQKQWKGFEASWVQSAQQPHNPQEPVIIDQNGNIISGTHTTNTATPNVVGRQTAANIAANMQGW
ncbi:hypothetical protein HMPREF1551_00549 [Capnocytophaga sp. oral taxon 863 str. F0517]|uniref:DUF6291 domain-containing protein n=1 Tax=Capnocytophaga sp. oral taxon 863 TaxID=1227265 RepID=UPI000396676F|nr:DUF6291 domain-containing protein [Capnocytophaga sp. oral taxon 863]ERI64310.1 hypothetical protein HMPREF1551_00549 [Capnocytophaga sp. oral taxon 863 str. F0517]